MAGGTDPILKAFRLPALRSLGELADRSPVILIDTREQEPQVFERLASIRGTLTTGDYSVAGLQDHFSIERKTVSDLVGCCMEREPGTIRARAAPTARLPVQTFAGGRQRG
jgi:hypothetical protein